MSTLVKQEMDLAKSELKQQVTKLGKGAGLFGGAGVAGLLTLFFISLALTYLLDNWMPIELAALIVALLWGIATAVMAARGRKDQGSQPATPNHATDPERGHPMGENADELKRTSNPAVPGATTPEEIAVTLANLSRDIDELADKVTPGRIMERRKEAAKSRFGHIRDRVMGSVSAAPQHVSSAGSTIGDTASGAASSVSETAHGALDTLESRTQGNPLAAGLVAFGAGMLVSPLIPASSKETQLAQTAVEAAKEHGQPLIDEAKTIGQDIGAELKDSATTAAQEVKATAQDSLGTVKNEGQTSVQHVKEEAVTD